ncbi:YmL10 [Arachnomyces sp. PD_36]|nr:YmL10 [Arachnomyces sp. PD_36]
MPPRISLLSHLPSPSQLTSSTTTTTAQQHTPSFLLPLFQNLQLNNTPPPARGPGGCRRHASILASLSDIPGAYNKRIRRGRGPSSGKGKTSGRGHKGQKQHGKVPAGFAGGQTPDIVVHGERGFDNIFSLNIAPINLDRIQEWINQGRIDPTKPITVRELAHSRCIHGVKDGVKLLARGGPDALSQPINIVVSRASASAIEAVEKAGGTITTRFYTRHAISRILRGKTDPFVSLAWEASTSSSSSSTDSNSEPTPPQRIGMGADKPLTKGNGFQYRLPDPSNRKDIEYYRDPAHRGYLSYLVKDNEGPSLYFHHPENRLKKAGKGGVGGGKKGENRVW